MATGQYANAVHEAEQSLLAFLQTFESIQNDMRVERLAEFQAQLRAAAPDSFADLTGRLSQAGPPEDLRQFHDAFVAGIRHCGNAGNAFLSADERSYSLTGMDVRRSLCRGLQVLYGVRAHTPTLADYWLLPDATPERDALDTPASDAGAPVGVIHRRRAAPLADYSLYVPESYTPSRNWPLIVCLHGAYGRGDHFLWSWLRPAKSRGYMLLAPKSLDVTWSILQPERDAASVVAMLDEVCGEYAVDRSRSIPVGAVRWRHVHLPAGAGPPRTVRRHRPRRRRLPRDAGRYVAPQAGPLTCPSTSSTGRRITSFPCDHPQRTRSAATPGLQRPLRRTAGLGPFLLLIRQRRAGDAVVRGAAGLTQ